MSYMPTGCDQFATPMLLQTPRTIKELGVVRKEYSTLKTIFTTVKSYGGTESVVNNIIQVLDTIDVTTWYDTDIKADCRLVNPFDNTTWIILGRPEDIEFRHVYMKFKCQHVGAESGC